jgi:hypothetical protein
MEGLGPCLPKEILSSLSSNVKIKSTDMTFRRARHQLPSPIINEILKLREPDIGQQRSYAFIAMETPTKKHVPPMERKSKCGQDD